AERGTRARVRRAHPPVRPRREEPRARRPRRARRRVDPDGRPSLRRALCRDARGRRRVRCRRDPLRRAPGLPRPPRRGRARQQDADRAAPAPLARRRLTLLAATACGGSPLFGLPRAKAWPPGRNGPPVLLVLGPEPASERRLLVPADERPECRADDEEY